MNKHPNFFIVGAPKCGTTSLAYYLSEHKKVFFSTPKEPCFFSAPEFPGPVSNFNEYLNLFKGADSSHLAIGEGSVWYLCSTHAIADILERFPDSKFIVMLRNPVEASFSGFVQTKKGVSKKNRDQFKSFEKAWHAQNERAKGLHIPKGCSAPKKFQYGKVFSYSHQLERLFSLVNKKNIHVIIFDDFKLNTDKEYRKVLTFLGLPYQKLETYEARNKMGVIHVDSLFKRILISVLSLGIKIKDLLGIRKTLNVVSKFHDSKDIKIERPNEKFRTELIEYFHDDIEKLESLLDRDLSAWKK